MAGYFFDARKNGNKGKGKSKGGGNGSGGGNNKSVQTSGGSGSGNWSGGGSGNGSGSKAKVEIKTHGDILFKSFEKYEKHRPKYMSFYFNLTTNEFEKKDLENGNNLFDKISKYKQSVTPTISSEAILEKGNQKWYVYLSDFKLKFKMID